MIGTENNKFSIIFSVGIEFLMSWFELKEQQQQQKTSESNWKFQNQRFQKIGN